MSDTGLSRSPKFEKGALVQLLKDVVGVVPNVIPFQYNPEKLSHTLTPWNPFEVRSNTAWRTSRPRLFAHIANNLASIRGLLPF